MHRTLLFAPFIALLGTATSSCAARQRATGASPARAAIRVVSYNIHAGKDAEQHPNLERVAAVLDSLDADIVLLQEVDRGTERSGRVDQVAELERLTGMHGAFAKSLDFQGGDYGIAALSRWPIESTETVPLPTDPPADRGVKMYEPRVAIHVVVSTPAGALHVVGTHLGAENVSTFRDQEARGLLEHLRKHVPAGVPLLIGGDFNSTPDSDVHAGFASTYQDSWQACGAGDGYTFPADSAVRRIDYLYVRGLQCTAARVVDTQASDHRPLLVTFHAPEPAASEQR
ncbi:MAG TPA: endonuclease/exonuclease/phosphatase family protein [Gemmatimonadaceae bacterium]|nr:endonuclease/exonuclease/phosphatase family protein [Gemmatimonadaceae bacterium]